MTVHSFHYHGVEHNNGLLHCSANTATSQTRYGGDVPLFLNLPNGQVERMHFGFVNF